MLSLLFGDGIASILCCTSYFPPGRVGENDENNNGYLAEWVLWNIDHPVHTIPIHHPTQMDVLPKTLFKLSWLLQFMVSAAFKYVPQPTETTFAFSSVFFSLLSLSFFCGTESKFLVNRTAYKIQSFSILRR